MDPTDWSHHPRDHQGDVTLGLEIPFTWLASSPKWRGAQKTFRSSEPVLLPRCRMRKCRTSAFTNGGEQWTPIWLNRDQSAGGAVHQFLFGLRLTLPYRIEGESEQMSFYGTSGKPFLLGLIHGHWEIPPRTANDTQIKSPHPNDEQWQANVGLTVAIPAHKILEVLHHPKLVVKCGEWEQSKR